VLKAEPAERIAHDGELVVPPPIRHRTSPVTASIVVISPRLANEAM
jgi:hypothetical protein